MYIIITVYTADPDTFNGQRISKGSSLARMHRAARVPLLAAALLWCRGAVLTQIGDAAGGGGGAHPAAAADPAAHAKMARLLDGYDSRRRDCHFADALSGHPC